MKGRKEEKKKRRKEGNTKPYLSIKCNWVFIIKE